MATTSSVAEIHTSATPEAHLLGILAVGRTQSYSANETIQEGDQSITWHARRGTIVTSWHGRRGTVVMPSWY